MKMRIKFKIIGRGRAGPLALATLAAALILGGHPGPAHADRRAYATTYEAVTAPKGELDVETWSTYARDGEVLDGPPSKGFRNMVELEYGLTDRWDVALYNLLDVTSDSGTGYAGLKLETRYRLLPAASWIVDPVIYFELQYLRHGDASEKAEVKLILARDEGPWNFAFNLAAEAERAAVTGDLVPETEYALGVSRELAGPAVKLGVEIFGKAEKPPGQAIEAFAWTGPALSWATRFPTSALHGLWITAGAGRGLTSHSETWYGRAIVGLQF